MGAVARPLPLSVLLVRLLSLPLEKLEVLVVAGDRAVPDREDCSRDGSEITALVHRGARGYGLPREQEKVGFPKKWAVLMQGTLVVVTMTFVRR